MPHFATIDELIAEIEAESRRAKVRSLLSFTPIRRGRAP